MSTTMIAILEKTASSLRQVADALGESAEGLAERAIQQFLRQEAERKVEQEEDIYRQQHAQLLEQYAGQYIAMHDGEVIDSDADELALFLRIRKEYPLVGILIKKVTSEPQEEWIIRL